LLISVTLALIQEILWSPAVHMGIYSIQAYIYVCMHIYIYIYIYTCIHITVASNIFHLRDIKF